jgi:hypothetical protein
VCALPRAHPSHPSGTRSRPGPSGPALLKRPPADLTVTEPKAPLRLRPATRVAATAQRLHQSGCMSCAMDCRFTAEYPPPRPPQTIPSLPCRHPPARRSRETISPRTRGCAVAPGGRGPHHRRGARRTPASIPRGTPPASIEPHHLFRAPLSSDHATMRLHTTRRQPRGLGRLSKQCAGSVHCRGT